MVYQGKRIETVIYYKYLGITFSSRLKQRHYLKTLALQSIRALIKSIKYLASVAICPCSSDYNNSIYVQFLSEVWVCEYREEIELLQRIYYNMLLGVASSISNNVVLGGDGRLHSYYMYLVKYIKVWLKLVRTEHCYIKTSYDVLNKLDDAGNTYVRLVK